MTRLGVYYAPEHGFQQDRDYIAALQPPVIRILDPDVQNIADMHALCPNAIIAPRTWVIDDHDGQAVRNLMADPIGTGRNHAERYRGQLGEWLGFANARGLTLPPTERILFNSANEPNQGGTPDKIAAYSIAFLDHCTELGIRACAPCLGVGWPDNTGPDTPVDWSPYAGLDQAIRRNGGMLSIHEYFYKAGPQDGWRWLAGRHLQCPFDVPILLGEIGIDNYVDAERWQREGGNRGWQGHVSPDEYAEMIEYHIRNSDTRVVAALPFITDFRSPSWESFNTRAAHAALLARKDRMVPQVAFTASTPPHETRLPAVGTGEPPTLPPAQPHLPVVMGGIPETYLWVQVPAGANIRRFPVDGDVMVAVPYGARVQLMQSDWPNGWHSVRYGDHTGWIRSDLLSATKPPQSVEPPSGNDWPRIYAFIKRWEGGFVDHPSDPGGATNKGVTIGTFIRWRTERGLPTPTVADLRALTDAEAEQIFFEWYYKASGADRLAWPLNLAQADTAVNAGVERAKEMLARSNGNFLAYMGHLIDWYTRIQNFEHFGRAWIRRRAEILLEASK